MSGLGQLAHLVRRFLGSLRPGGPDPADERWALARLGDGERDLWRRMSDPDQRHAIEVARNVSSHLGGRATRPVLAAALLHDVGKVESGFGTPARVVATCLWAAVPDDRAEQWVDGSGWRQRMAYYRLHPALGEQLLIDAGADVLTSSWAGDHHLPKSAWRVELELGQVLKDCDDD